MEYYLTLKDYTKASDIYGFGIIAYEVCTGLPPYHDIVHDEFLAARICQGLRPKSDYKIPQLILDVIKQCWDANPLKRLNAYELKTSILNLNNNAKNENSLINKQIREADEINKKSFSLTSSFSVYLLVFSHILHILKQFIQVDFWILKIFQNKKMLMIMK